MTQGQRKNPTINHLDPRDAAAHDWYRFVLSYPPHLVAAYIERFGVAEGQWVLDPFSGTGTTVVECKKRGFRAIGIEANPLAAFAGQVKLDWSPEPEELWADAERIADCAYAQLQRDGLEDAPMFLPSSMPPLRTLPAEQMQILLTDSISPLPLHKVLVLRDAIQAVGHFRNHARLALAKIVVGPVGNLHFGPEVGVGKPKSDAAVIAPWLATMRQMAEHLSLLRRLPAGEALVHHADARNVSAILAPKTIHAVITSPPYPNEKDYTRTTRLEAVLLGFLHNKAELRAMKQGLLRSNTRNVYVRDDDDLLVADHPEINRIADAIEARRIELGKNSGFERLYARTTRLYFGGMKRHLAALRPLLHPGAELAYVVGDQASYLQVMIKTGELLANIAESLGYQVTGIDLFRTRLATATRAQLREEVVLLRWGGAV
ncbi:MAG: DNA methyltransferase [Candidatus Viridilinea halotolerans]|uniref:site-specific DNA-methyltransferase (cytosine-N(4)-specific) n=1 Tax=Candidatus Viridilinea halotolerans TaxID=2491704 RepID=A0A426TSE9_9CHLR|nr:MAG: DNA methyltransferase [Candidatus Viridilinea halotolerans]